MRVKLDFNDNRAGCLSCWRIQSGTHHIIFYALRRVDAVRWLLLVFLLQAENLFLRLIDTSLQAFAPRVMDVLHRVRVAGR